MKKFRQIVHEIGCNICAKVRDAIKDTFTEKWISTASFQQLILEARKLDEK